MEDATPERTNEEFVEFFMVTYNSLLNKIGRKYEIPNRYSVEDIKQYISERMLQILRSRQNKENKIESPEKYFKTCLDFYCIEYQRMHGYVFDLPKRPRKNCEADESYVRSFGFKYIGDVTAVESQQLVEDKYDPSEFESSDPPPIESHSPWAALTGILDSSEANVIECVYMRNMTWAETSRHLDVAQSTCWFRKNRALQKLYRAFDSLSGASTSINIRMVLRGNEDKLRELGYETD